MFTDSIYKNMLELLNNDSILGQAYKYPITGKLQNNVLHKFLSSLAS